MEDQTQDKPAADLLAEPAEMLCGIRAGGGVRFHLYRDYAAVGKLDQDVHLMLAVAVPEVKHARAQFADGAFGAQLGRDERVDDPAEKVPVAQYRARVEAEKRTAERWVDEIPFGQADKAVQLVRRLCGDALNHQYAFKQRVVGVGGGTVDLDRVDQGLQCRRSSRIGGDRLEVAPKFHRVTDSAD